MKLLVTGGAGFIGSNFIRYMLRAHPDYEIINLDFLTYAGNLENLRDIEKDPRYRFVKGDIRDPKIVDELMPRVDAVANFAAETHVDRSIIYGGDFILTDVFGTFVLLEAARKYKIQKFLQVGTDEVYGDLENGGYAKETNTLNPSSLYSASKAGGDFQVLATFRTYGQPAMISRCTNNYGPFMYPEKFIPLAITNILEEKKVPVYGDGKQIRDWLYVEDHCRALDVILQKGQPGEIYNIGANQQPEVNNLEVLKMVLLLMGKDDSCFEFVKDRAGHDRRYAVDTAKIRALGWKPEVTIAEGLELTVNWYKNNIDWWKHLKSENFQKYYEEQYKKR